MNSRLRSMRITQAVFILYAIGLLFIMARLHPSPAAQGYSLQFFWVIAVIAVVDPAIGFVLRAKLFEKSRSADLPYKQRLQAWYSGNIIGFAFSTATCLFGLVLFFLGGSARWARVLLCFGVIMLLFQNLGEPPEERPGSSI